MENYEREKFHHSYLMTGGAETAFKAALKMAAEILAVEESILTVHPDVKFYKNTTFLIGEAREIRDSASRKSFSGRGRIFIIKAGFFTSEACNALLKTMEEPAGLSYFFVITPSPENVPVTLRSRFILLQFGRPHKLPEAKEKFVKKFLKSLSQKRSEMVKKIAEDKEKTADFLDGLESVLAEQFRKNFRSDLSEIVFSLEEVEKHCRLLSFQSSAPKMILEHLCLVLPKFNI